MTTDYIKRRKAQEKVKEAIRIVAVHPNGKLPSQEATDIFLKCMSAINDIPSADVVPKSIYEQTKWERDFAEKRADDMSKLIRNKDVVAVVRCKDCKHRQEDVGMGDHRWCDIVNGSRCSDDYCSYGERAEA